MMVGFEADILKYNIVSIMGQGYDGAAVVYLAKHLPSNKMVAIKKINMDKAKEEAHLIQVSLKENHSLASFTCAFLA